MQTIQKPIAIQDDTDHAIAWLKAEYPKGVALHYVDRGDSLDDRPEIIADLIADGYSEEIDEAYWDDTNSENEIIENYRVETESDELSDEVHDTMREWLRDHDTSNIQKDLLRNTSSQLFFIYTDTETGSYDSMEKEAYQDQIAMLYDIYAKTDEQKKEISSVLNNQYYSAPVSFYFYADVAQLVEAIHSNTDPYIVIDGAYFSTIDRVQGSNWLGDKAVFKIAIKREDIEKIKLDKAKGTGYGWDSIAGQSSYNEASVYSMTELKPDTLTIAGHESEEIKREKRLADNWEKTKTCTLGDMNYQRHSKENIEYINNFPCGSKCKSCGTFWTD